MRLVQTFVLIFMIFMGMPQNVFAAENNALAKEMKLNEKSFDSLYEERVKPEEPLIIFESGQKISPPDEEALKRDTAG